MDDSDLPPATTPRFWIAFTLLCLTFVVAFVMAVFSSTNVEAQEQPLCAPLSQLVPMWEQVHKEHVAWEGVMPTPQGVLEMVLFQPDKGTWSLFIVQGGVACLRAAGKDGTPINDNGV